MTKGKYVDGFVFTVSAENVAAYKKMAGEGARTWKKFGALDYKECMAEDFGQLGPTMPFTKLTKAKEGDTVWFSFIVFKSKKHRDEVNKKVMEYLEKKYEGKDMTMPFDMKRMAYGGFKVEVG